VDHAYEHLCLASLLASHFGFSSSDTVGGGGIHRLVKVVIARQLALVRQPGEYRSVTTCHAKHAATRRASADELLALLLFLQNTFGSGRKAPGSGIKELRDPLPL